MMHQSKHVTRFGERSEPALGRLYADLGLGYDVPNTVDVDEDNFAGEHGEGRQTFGLAVPRRPARAKPQHASRQTGAFLPASERLYQYEYS